MQVVSRRVVTVAYGEPVHHVMQFDPADPGFLFLMTSHQVRPEPSLTRSQDELSSLACQAFAHAAPAGASSLLTSFACLPFTSQCSHHFCREALFSCFLHHSVKLQFPQSLMALAHQADFLGEGPAAPLSWAPDSASRWPG